MLRAGMIVRIRCDESRTPCVVQLTEACGPSGRIWFGEVLHSKNQPETTVLAQSQIVAVRTKNGDWQMIFQGMFG